MEKEAKFDEYVEKLSADTEAAHKKALDTAGRLHKGRVVAAEGLCALMTDKLRALSFDNVTMQIAVDDDPGNLSAAGIDDVDILVSFNLGEPVKSLSKVASGGELSRFMLALKEVTALKGGVETLVFDEIDSGISGKTAWNVSGSMKNLSSSHQVIAITHLPQIAARADEHYLIEKHTEGEFTVTDIHLIEGESRVEEIARLLSGGELTEAGMDNARELIASAK
jgi:DNA repair protein RecN (Recombination protein N)